MKNISAFSLLFFGILFFQPLQMPTAYAQTYNKKIDFYIEAGAGIPAAPIDFTQYYNTGYGIGAGIGYEIRPSVKLQLFGEYHRFSFDEEGARKNVAIPQTITAIDGAETQLFSAMLNIIYQYKLPGIATSTYFSVGAGYFRASRSDFTITTSSKTTNIDQNSGSSLGVNGGVGLEHELNNNLSIYAGAKFVTGLFVDRRTQYVPISVGIIF